MIIFDQKRRRGYVDVFLVAQLRSVLASDLAWLWLDFVLSYLKFRLGLTEAN